MRWKVSIEGSDEITSGQRCEFEIEKSFDDLIDGSVGLSVEDGKTILASLQQHLVQQQCALYVLFRRHCQGCGGTWPIKDYSTRTIQTVYSAVTVQSPRPRGGLLNLRTYIEQNRGSIANYGARYREGKRIASTSAEAGVNNLAARLMVKKQQMRWSERGANLLLQVRVALANGDLTDRLPYQPPVQPRQTIISPFVPLPLFQRAA